MNSTEPTPIAHRNVALLQASADALDELVADSSIRPFVWMRFAPDIALIDPTATDRVKQALIKLGKAVSPRRDLATGGS